MTRARMLGRPEAVFALALAIAMALAPGTALADSGELEEATPVWGDILKANRIQRQFTEVPLEDMTGRLTSAAAQELADARTVIARGIVKTSKVLPYDPAAIDAIGTQEQTGHTICCPSFSCAYADAVLDGTIHDHDYYTCSCCTWTDWGGGGSSNRCVGSDEELLREAYDQITAGKPTVIHVSWSGGEHWIALIGYEDAVDPDHLTLSNFITLDPWDGVQLNAGSKYVLYGDGCEHISDR